MRGGRRVVTVDNKFLVSSTCQTRGARTGWVWRAKQAASLSEAPSRASGGAVLVRSVACVPRACAVKRAAACDVGLQE